MYEFINPNDFVGLFNKFYADKITIYVSFHFFTFHRSLDIEIVDLIDIFGSLCY